jgi:hypothetical protein
MINQEWNVQVTEHVTKLLLKVWSTTHVLVILVMLIQNVIKQSRNKKMLMQRKQKL